ncbi:hypothetical protein Pmani_007998 [Petrolisthes manimaculis]|uniref:Uncharacterized protein n=1 Tax=Petrolisthes manimaculis TaxID=1843537 RepID=A0AAE1Q7T7_9EUCA|nr:hypothetical protein Pmani_007998 [Petrolisthes manimaculis]
MGLWLGNTGTLANHPSILNERERRLRQRGGREVQGGKRFGHDFNGTLEAVNSPQALSRNGMSEAVNFTINCQGNDISEAVNFPQALSRNSISEAVNFTINSCQEIANGSLQFTVKIVTKIVS